MTVKWFPFPPYNGVMATRRVDDALAEDYRQWRQLNVFSVRENFFYQCKTNFHVRKTCSITVQSAKVTDGNYPPLSIGVSAYELGVIQYRA